MNYFPISRLLLGLATLFAVLVLTGCATGPIERRIELEPLAKGALRGGFFAAGGKGGGCGRPFLA